MAVAPARRRVASDDDVDRLRRRFRGALLRPGESGYDEARVIWNAMFDDRRPALIARCTGTADIVAAIEFARKGEWYPSVRGGGHGAPGYAVCDGDLMIDLAAMRGVYVDPVAQRARAQGGATWAEFDRETQVHGLATPGGAVSHTGIAGLTLGGGYGWLSRAFGQTADNLIAAEIVTADGRVINTDAETHQDLFWALKGGGGNFGIVSSFEYRLHRVGPVVTAGPIVYSFDHAKEVYRFYREYCATAPDACGLNCFVMSAPPLPAIPKHLHGKTVIFIIACWAGDPARAEEALRPLRGFGSPLVDLIAEIPYTTLRSMFDLRQAPGQRSYWKSGYVDELTDAAIDTLVEYGGKLSSPLSMTEIGALGRAITRSEEGASGKRSAGFNQLVLSRWTEGAQDEQHIAFSREFYNAMGPHYGGGVYVNYLSIEGADRIHEAYGPTFKRLAEIKRAYDPGNLFRRNQNIPPATA